MEIHQVITYPSTPKDSSLYAVVNDLIRDTAPMAVHHRNYIVNNIPADLSIEANGTIVTSVLNKLFSTIVRNTQNSVILISAKVYGMTVLIQVKSKGLISPGLAAEIGHASLKAQKTGGIVEMIQCESEQASVAYCFLNVAAA